MKLKLTARAALVAERVLKWMGRRDRALVADPAEFSEVFDQVLEDSDWVWLRTGALERSWRADPAKWD